MPFCACSIHILRFILICMISGFFFLSVVFTMHAFILARFGIQYDLFTEKKAFHPILFHPSRGAFLKLFFSFVILFAATKNYNPAQLVLIHPRRVILFASRFFIFVICFWGGRIILLLFMNYTKQQWPFIVLPQENKFRRGKKTVKFLIRLISESSLCANPKATWGQRCAPDEKKN